MGLLLLRHNLQEDIDHEPFLLLQFLLLIQLLFLNLFLLNGDVLLSDPHEVAIFMAEGKNNVALIEKSDLKQFLETTNDLNLKIKEISIVKGFNIAKGRHVEIYIFQNQLFDLSN